MLNGHKRRTDSVSIATQEFVSHNKNRKRSFGTSVGGLFNILPILDSITRVDVYVIFVVVVNQMASKCMVNGETPPDFLALPPYNGLRGPWHTCSCYR